MSANQFVSLDDSALCELADQIALRISSVHQIESISCDELFSLYFQRHVKTRLKNAMNAKYFFSSHGTRWNGVLVHTIKRSDVQEWVDEIALSSPSSATRALDMFRSILNWGIRTQVLPPLANPCNGVEKYKLESRTRFAIPAELRRLKESLDREPSFYRDFFWLCLLTGARKGNILSMRWSEIDLELAIWTIPAEKFKNGDEHIIPLNGSALAILNRRSELRDSVSVWVFPGKTENHHLKDPKRAWARITKNACIENLRIHDLRRTFGSYMAMNGENQYVIAQLLGHKDLRSTAFYARLDLTSVRRASDSVSTVWQNICSLQTPSVGDLPKRTTGALPTLMKSGAKNGHVRISATEQVVVEAKIITAIRAGGRTKKSFYKKIGSQLQVNRFEMNRILREMEARHLLSCNTDDKGRVFFSLCED